MTGPISPCLWFDGDAEDAARHYTSIFDNAAIDHVWRHGPDAPMPEGSVLFVEFTLRGQKFQALNGGPGFPHSNAMSLSVDCADQAEVDRVWDGFLAGGGEPMACGWLKDRFGVPWQIIPRRMLDMQRSGSPDQVARLMAAMMTMVKLDIVALEAAYRGDAQ